MIVLFTDFGLEGPYLGQVRAVLHQQAPGVPVVDLFADLAPFDPVSAAYLLPAYGGAPFPDGSVFLAVVDPGVGTDRPALVVRAGGRWFVGPDNGLLSRVAAEDEAARAWTIGWRPDRLSASFHGRDLFAPVAAALAVGGEPGRGAPLDCAPVPIENLVGADWPAERSAVVYIDRYGNAMTGLRADRMRPEAVLRTGAGRDIRRGETFAAVPPGEAFWYANSNGLVEVACNGARADRTLGLRVGDVLVRG